MFLKKSALWRPPAANTEVLQCPLLYASLFLGSLLPLCECTPVGGAVFRGGGAQLSSHVRTLTRFDRAGSSICPLSSGFVVLLGGEVAGGPIFGF